MQIFSCRELSGITGCLISMKKMWIVCYGLLSKHQMRIWLREYERGIVFMTASFMFLFPLICHHMYIKKVWALLKHLIITVNPIIKYLRCKQSCISKVSYSSQLIHLQFAAHLSERHHLGANPDALQRSFFGGAYFEPSGPIRTRRALCHGEIKVVVERVCVREGRKTGQWTREKGARQRREIDQPTGFLWIFSPTEYTV